ncbi:hydrogenase-4 component B [Peptoclostridium acidaminophilum DSM 3953]|uniref:Hydrogenase-4 component B n=1 Tax=Peptoclostridium acidaminophilum DSM 3953 TaxID=1286171 RepID=W8T2L3_PEPAC|nr:proton-conducting transporter membrane subunit [Peptoclostridium acidaminophilum]AHM55984.1 hydrogenase-4 component B [Peptoclostridium acidaminophilum DSM 3953]
MEMASLEKLFSIMILVYLMASGAPLLMKRHQELANHITGILCSIGGIIGIVLSLMKLLGNAGDLAFNIANTNIPYLSFTIGIDNISAFFILSLSVLAIPVSIYSVGYVSRYYGKSNTHILNSLYALFIISMAFVFVARNMVTFYMSWELMALLSYFLIMYESEKKETVEAGTLYIIMTHVGTAFLLAAFTIIYAYTGSFEFASEAAAVPSTIKNVLFVLFLIGFGAKAGVVPLHIWMPSAYPVAPSHISALMSGIMAKTAIYGLLRFVFDILKADSMWWGMAILAVGILSAVIGVAYAYMESNIKRMIAFSSIENIGIILMGLGIAGIASHSGDYMLKALAITAAMVHCFNHTVFKGLLFMSAGSIEFSTQTKQMNELGGLMKTMPLTGLFMLVGSLAISAAVPFNGFIGEWLTYQAFIMGISSEMGTINVALVLGAASLGLAGALAAGCFVKLIGICFMGSPRSSSAQKAKEVPVSMSLASGFLALLCIGIGIFPKLLIGVAAKAFYTLSGSSIMQGMNGFGVAPVYSLSLDASQITPVAAVIAGVAAAIAMAAVIAAIGGKREKRIYTTWDCGFERLNPRMQYSSTGFSNPIGIVLRLLFRPVRELKIDSGSILYTPKSIKYTLKTESIFEKYMYGPIAEFFSRISVITKISVQTGSIHGYLMYIFVTVFVFMIYNSLV